MQVVSNGFLFVKPYIFGIGADKPLVENSPRKQFEMFFLQGTKQASPNLARIGDIVERDTTHLAFATKPFAK
jgi:hypothetical protein